MVYSCLFFFDAIVIDETRLQDKETEALMLSDPQVMHVLKKQVQEALIHVRSLNQKLDVEKKDPNSDEIKVGTPVPCDAK
jgi:hypothetical protein